MKKIHIRTTALLAIVGALCALGIVAATSFAESEDDNWTPAQTPFKAVSTNSSFTAAGQTAECKPFELKGITPQGKGGHFTEIEAQAKQNQTKVDPSVANCNFATTVSGPWHVKLHSEGPGFSGQCKTNVGEDDDCITIETSQNGAEINFIICTVKVKANIFTTDYDDETGTIEIKEQPISVEGCGVTEAKFKGTFSIKAIKQNGEEAIIKDGE